MWIVLAVFIFLLVLLLLFPLYVYFIETKTHFAMKSILNLFYQVEMKGLENLPSRGPYLLACNHLSYLDWMLIIVKIPRPVHFVIYYRFYEAKILKPLLKKVGTIPISGGAEKPKLIVKAFRRVSDDLNQGNVVLIFPEGGITRDGQIREFQKGVARIKKNSTAPLIPMVIAGAWGSFFSYSPPGLFSFKKLSFKKRKITINIYPEYKNFEDLEGLKKVIFSDVSLREGRYVLS